MDTTDLMDDSTAELWRCTATSKRSGEQCKRHPVAGATVCTMHGGGAPQARRAAERRLREMVEPALAALDMILRDPEALARDKIRAAVSVLDRAGFHHRRRLA